MNIALRQARHQPAHSIPIRNLESAGVHRPGSLGWRRGLTACLAVYLCFTSYGCKKESPKLPKAIPAVKVFEVAKESQGAERRFSGEVQATDKTTLSFGVGGTIDSLIATPGLKVSKGQLLASLDPKPLQLKVENARASLTSSRSKLLEAQSSFDRTASLLQQNATSQKNYDSAKAALSSAQGTLNGAEAQLEQAEIDLGRIQLVAPFDGQVVHVPIEQFEEVAGSQEAVVLQVVDILEVDVLIPETLIQNVDIGQAVTITFSAITNLSVEGVVQSVSAESTTGNAYSVKVRVGEQGNDVRPGMTATVQFVFGQTTGNKPVFLIPLSSIAVDEMLNPEPVAKNAQGNQAPIFLFDPETQQVQRKSIRVGDIRGNEVEVFEGLSKGDLVVSAGLSFVRDNMAAQVWTPRK